MTHLEAKYVVSGVLNDLIIFLLAEPSTQCAVQAPKSYWVTIHFPEITFFLYVKDQFC